LTALASESRNYSVYELEGPTSIEVEAYRDNVLLRKIRIGKNTPASQHTFVMIDSDHRVYHSGAAIRSYFDKSVSDLRDKKVMTIIDDITDIELKKGGEELRITRAADPVSVDITSDSKNQNVPDQPARKWTAEDGQTLKDGEIDRIISTLSNLSCDEFIENKTKDDFSEPVFNAKLKGTTTYTISIFEKTGEKYPAISSGSDYPFLISEWQAKKIMKDLKDLIIETK
jgi:hypothetical protein